MSDPETSLNKSDEEILKLVEHAQKGDKIAFGKLYELFSMPLYRYLFAILNNQENAEEAVQEAFINAWKSLPHLNSHTSFKSWLYKIATNAALGLLRRQKSNESSLDALAQYPTQMAFEERVEELELIALALNKVAPKPRISLLLSSEGFSHREIASILEISVKSVGTYISQGRQVFRQAYQRLNKA